MYMRIPADTELRSPSTISAVLLLDGQNPDNNAHRHAKGEEQHHCNYRTQLELSLQSMCIEAKE
jgi:hypothetical protein